MDFTTALKFQYHAALKYLLLAMEGCPDDRWDDPRDKEAPFWRVTYHILFFTHMYCQQDHGSFTPWEYHQEGANDLGDELADSDWTPAECKPYTREQMLDYWRICEDSIDKWIDAINLSAADSGFPWYPETTKIEHQLINLRHIQHHTGALVSRLRREDRVAIAWVGRAKR